jgi:hypothetical protein
MNDTAFEPELIVVELNAAGVEYVIVGGLAVGAHGVIRATRDLDLVADGSAKNMDRLAACLAAMGGRHPIQDELTGERLSCPASFKVHTRHGEVQVLNRMPGVPPYAQLASDRLLVELSPGSVAPICSLAHLRAMKAAAGRPRDLVDLAELTALHGDG